MFSGLDENRQQPRTAYIFDKDTGTWAAFGEQMPNTGCKSNSRLKVAVVSSYIHLKSSSGQTRGAGAHVLPPGSTKGGIVSCCGNFQHDINAKQILWMDLDQQTWTVLGVVLDNKSDGAFGQSG